MNVPFESNAALLITLLSRTSAPNFTLCFAALHVTVSENWYASVMRPCGKLLAPPMLKRPVMVTLGLTGSFSGKSRFAPDQREPELVQLVRRERVRVADGEVRVDQILEAREAVAEAAGC